VRVEEYQTKRGRGAWVSIAVLACFARNLAMRFRLWNRMSSFLEPARELRALVAAGQRLAAPQVSAGRATTARLGSALLRLGWMPRAVSWLAADRTSGNQVAAVVR
jgi:hypothetical protein